MTHFAVAITFALLQCMGRTRTLLYMAYLFSLCYPSVLYQVFCQSGEDMVAVEGEVVGEDAAIASTGVDVTATVGDVDLEEIMEGWIDFRI